MKRIIYTCPYVPAEWIAAHSLQPSRVMPRSADHAGEFGQTEGLCPFVRAFINEALTSEQAHGVIVTTVCDQMRRAFDIISAGNLPTFLMNIPNTWQNPAVKQLYADELNRLGQFLCQMGGKSPSEGALAKTMLEYDAIRKTIYCARDLLMSRQYSQAIAEFNAVGKCVIDRFNKKSQAQDRIPLALIGGPLLKQDFEIFDVIEQAGGNIVLDATETGQRGLCRLFDRDKLTHDPLAELASAYFDGILDASRRPNNRLFDWLGRELTARKIRGLILRRYIWCDIWHGEFYRLKQVARLPVLDIDVNGEEQLSERIISRIQAFLETLQ
jgi:benzoyl-CoA reductase/2-hydroxyglutaryl-CoA dehydratase subunit BcrC/BadD/HgdB